MKKIFIIAGEASGDSIGGWYLKKLQKKYPNLVCDAIGGEHLHSAGATLHASLKELNIVGIVEIIKHIPYILSYLKRLCDHIISNEYDHVVLVDFPGFNMRLGRMLKKRNSYLKIIYLSPPQLWAWGAWRLKNLQMISDQILVIYPFEVAWYASRGVHTKWVGCPTYHRLKPYISIAQNKEEKIALLPASRPSELKTLMPIMADVIKQFIVVHPEVEIIIPVAQTLTINEIERALYSCDRLARANIRYVQTEQNILRELSSCAVALTKPGTITLELALLRVPSIVMYKTSWLTYSIARWFVQIDFMALPNLMLKESVFCEYIQTECKPSNIANAMSRLYSMYKNEKKAYKTIVKKLDILQELLNNKIVLL